MEILQNEVQGSKFSAQISDNGGQHPRPPPPNLSFSHMANFKENQNLTVELQNHRVSWIQRFAKTVVGNLIETGKNLDTWKEEFQVDWIGSEYLDAPKYPWFSFTRDGDYTFPVWDV